MNSLLLCGSYIGLKGLSKIFINHRDDPMLICTNPVNLTQFKTQLSHWPYFHYAFPVTHKLSLTTQTHTNICNIAARVPVNADVQRNMLACRLVEFIQTYQGMI